MNEQRGFIPEEAGLLARGSSVIGRLPVYGRFRAAREGAFVRPFLFFMSCVTVAAGFYFFLFASPIYTSDAQVAVKGKEATPASPLMAALGGAQPGIPESTALTAYVTSAGMLKKLDASQQLRRQYSAFRTDFYYHLPAAATQHHFLSFYSGMVDVSLDPLSSIITLHVRAFDPKAAHETAMAIMKYSADYVAALSNEMMDESTRSAQNDLVGAKADDIKAHTATSAFQGRSGNLDPAAYGTAATTAIFQIEANVSQLRSQLASLMTYSTGRSPQVVQLQAQIAQLQGQKARWQQKLTGQQGGTIVGQLNTYQGLAINQTYADQRLVAAQTALDAAKSAAQQRQLFVVPITEPTLPDEPTPRRWWGFFTVLAVAACLYTIGRLMIASIRDHQV